MSEKTKMLSDKVITALNIAADYLQALLSEVNALEVRLQNLIQESKKEE